jgi:hypothetical protein
MEKVLMYFSDVPGGPLPRNFILHVYRELLLVCCKCRRKDISAVCKVLRCLLLKQVVDIINIVPQRVMQLLKHVFNLLRGAECFLGS